ncbi:MAG: hypothetical protein HZB51_27830 [Chloroflexi bacterium]|nr:hypothetical protein [Chloroflexota bacterium]
MNNQLARYASGAAYMVGVMSILSFVFLMLFFSLEAPQVASNPDGFHLWGFLSDIAGPLTMLPLIIIMLVLHQIERARAPRPSQVATVIGVIGALAVTILQILLVIRVLSFEQEVGPVVVAMGIVGVWLITANYLGLAQRILPSKLAWLGILVGMVQAAYPVLFQMLGGANFYNNLGSNVFLMILTSVIFLGSYIGFPIWAIGLARFWSNQRKTADVKVVYAH